MKSCSIACSSCLFLLNCIFHISLLAEVTEEISRVCMVKIESTNPLCQEKGAQHCISPPLPSIPGKSTLEQVTPVTVKQEKSEEETRCSSCCLDSFKIEEFSLECMSGVQSKMLEQWKPEVQNIQSQDSDTQLSGTGLEQGKRESFVS